MDIFLSDFKVTQVLMYGLRLRIMNFESVHLVVVHSVVKDFAQDCVFPCSSSPSPILALSHIIYYCYLFYDIYSLDCAILLNCRKREV